MSTSKWHKWLEVWDKLRAEVATKSSWGRNQLLALMDELERRAVREAERESEEKEP